MCGICPGNILVASNGWRVSPGGNCDKEATIMRGSQQDMPVAVDTGGGTIKQATWGDISVELGQFTAGADPAQFFQGVPDDRCQCPHWGYVVRGQLRFRYADRDEVYNAGDAYYAEPGHLPLIGDGTEYVEFSPIGP